MTITKVNTCILRWLIHNSHGQVGSRLPLAPAFSDKQACENNRTLSQDKLFANHKQPCLPRVIATSSLTQNLTIRYWLPCCTVTRPELASTLLDAPRRSSLDMCFFVASQHSCGHLHEKFGRCFFAKRDGICACNEPSFPIWQHSDPFPCPICFTDRKTDTNELLPTAKGGKRSDAKQIKKEPLQQDRRSSTQSAGQNVQAQPAQHSIHGEYANIGDQLQTLADNALKTSPRPDQAAEPASPPWIAPSRRYASIVGQLGSSPPPRLQTTFEATSSLSPDMLSGNEFSRPDSAIAPAYPEQFDMDSTEFALLLRQAK